MNENINFISAAELPEATGEEVSVLCLENGEMKQKPGISLGGKEYDMRIRYSSVDGSYKIIDGTYDQVVSKINNYVPPTIYFTHETSTYTSVILATANYNPNLNKIEVVADGVIFVVHPDNRIEISD